MNHSRPAQHASISHDFMTFGTEALGVHRAGELREARMRQQQITQSQPGGMPVPPVRHCLGGWMIALGSWIAGSAAKPSATAPKAMLAR